MITPATGQKRSYMRSNGRAAVRLWPVEMTRHRPEPARSALMLYWNRGLGLISCRMSPRGTKQTVATHRVPSDRVSTMSGRGSQKRKSAREPIREHQRKGFSAIRQRLGRLSHRNRNNGFRLFDFAFYFCSIAQNASHSCPTLAVDQVRNGLVRHRASGAARLRRPCRLHNSTAAVSATA
jgi:hypothetical protein